MTDPLRTAVETFLVDWDRKLIGAATLRGTIPLMFVPPQETLILLEAVQRLRGAWRAPPRTHVYQVWAYDAMDGSMGRDYVAATYWDEAAALTDRDARDARSRVWFERTADDGVRRAATEPWLWQHARVVAVEVK